MTPQGGRPLADIVATYGGFVRRTLAQMGVSARDLADVEQEVFRGVERGLPAFDPSRAAKADGALRGWLYGICERQAASYRRAETKRGETLFAPEELDYAASAAPTAEDVLSERDRVALLERLLAALEPRRRAVVVAYELEGVEMVDVAAAQGIPVNTAWNRLRLGRADLRRLARREQSPRHHSRCADIPALQARRVAVPVSKLRQARQLNG